MKKYRITVNGTTYEVEVEMTDEISAEKKEEPVKVAVPSSASGQVVAAPMPGTILSVKVAEGQTVRKGDVIFILEAMKMENEIASPADGTIRSIQVKKGDAVSSGATLCTLA